MQSCRATGEHAAGRCSLAHINCELHLCLFCLQRKMQRCIPTGRKINEPSAGFNFLWICGASQEAIAMEEQSKCNGADRHSAFHHYEKLVCSAESVAKERIHPKQRLRCDGQRSTQSSPHLSYLLARPFMCFSVIKKNFCGEMEIPFCWCRPYSY